MPAKSRKRTIARLVRLHCAWIAGVFVILDALASMWPLFEGAFPIPPLAYAGLGLFFAIASGVGHLYRND
jgi:hypothetical protein